MFIKYEKIKNEIVIDVRTVSEFNLNSIFKHNIPIINESEHQTIKNFYPTALFIIIRALYRNKDYIKKELLRISQNGSYPIVVTCSRGRLRSPIMFLYAKSLGINCKILYKGIKPILLNLSKLIPFILL